MAASSRTGATAEGLGLTEIDGDHRGAWKETLDDGVEEASLAERRPTAGDGHRIEDEQRRVALESARHRRDVGGGREQTALDHPRHGGGEHGGELSLHHLRRNRSRPRSPPWRSER